MLRLERNRGFARPVLPADLAEQMRELRTQNERLKEENAWLRGQIKPQLVPPREWKLSPDECAFLGVMIQRPLATYGALLAATYGLKGREEPTNRNVFSVRVRHMRVKLAPYGVSIHTLVDRGYYLDPADRERLRAELLSGNA